MKCPFKIIEVIFGAVKRIPFLLIAIIFWGCPIGGIVPPSRVISIRTFYSDQSGANLLNPATPGAFKSEEIKVEWIEEVKGNKKTTVYNEAGSNGIGLDPSSGSNCLFLTLPTNAYSNPIMTLVHLNPSITDTITSSFVSGRYGYMPEKVFYNRALVWEIENAQPGTNLWPPIRIVK